MRFPSVNLVITSSPQKAPKGVLLLVISTFNVVMTVRCCDVLQGGDVSCEGRDDGKEFANIRSAMKVLTYTDKEIADVLRVLAALLHIGNIKHKGESYVMSLFSANQIAFLLCHVNVFSQSSCFSSR
jgi:Myosin head (motor domain)